MSAPQLRILPASNRRLDSYFDPDRYQGVQVPVALEHLRSRPVLMVRLTDAQALALAAELIIAVQQRAATDAAAGQP